MLKEKFPIFKNYPELAYLDNASTTQKPEVVINAITEYYENFNANVHRGIYKLSESSTERYETARDTVANFIGAESKEIVFTSGTTDSINGAAKILSQEIKEGDTIISTELEHHSNFLPWQRLAKEKNAKFEVIKLNEDLTFDIEGYRQLLKRESVKVVAFSGMSNVTGYEPHIKDITKLAHEAGAKVILDAAQLIPHRQTNVKDLGVDMLAFSGHKIYGPTGIGVLYITKDLLADSQPFKVGGGMISEVFHDHSIWSEAPEKFEAGTPNMEGAIGLEASIKFVSEIGMEKIIQHELEIAQYAVIKLLEIEEVDMYLPKSELSPVIAFNINGVHAHDTADILDKHNVAVRAGHHCCQILAREILKVQSTARLSIGIYNKKEDIDKLVMGIKDVITKFK